MGKVKVFINRLASGSFKRMFQNANIIHQETKIPTISILADMTYCIFHYGIGYLEYRVYGFAGKEKAKRETYLTMNQNVALTHMLNDKEYYNVLDDKLVFNNRFKDYLGRDFLDMHTASLEDLKKFCQDKKEVFAKPTESFGGQGMEKIRIDKDTDFEKLHKHLIDNRQWSLEEVIQQHPKMNQLNPTSINTIRIVTLTIEGKPQFVYALSRVGRNNMPVDNISSGGMYTLISKEGTVTHPYFCDKMQEYYEIHPDTKMKLIGFEFPMFKEAVDLCLKAALVEPHLNYIGWDIAITPKGPVLVEGNNLPGYDMAQNYRFHDDGCGILPEFERVVGFKIPTKY